MTQDQRTAFVKLVEKCREDFRTRKAVSWDADRARKAELERELEAKHGVPALREQYETAKAAERAADAVVDTAVEKVRREMRTVELEESRNDAEALQVFMTATAEVLALDDAKDAQKVVERLIAL